MPSRPPRSSIFRNVALWLLGLVMIVLLTVVVYTYQAFRKAATEMVLSRDQQVTELSAARLEQAVQDYGELLTSLARSREMSGGIASQVAALNAAAPRLTVFDGGVILIDSRGRVRAAMPERPSLIARDWSGRDFYQAILGGDDMFIADAQQFSPSDAYAVVVAVPIRGEDNVFMGALAGAFRLGEATLSSFYASIVRLRLGQMGATYVVDGKGRILFDSESKRVNGFIRVDELSMIDPTGGAAAQLTQDESGRPVIAAHAPIPGTAWTLIVEEDWSTVTRETSHYRDVLIFSFVAALILPPLTLTLLSRQRRVPFLEIRRPDQDAGWLKAVREHLRPAELPLIPGWRMFAKQAAGKSAEHDFYDVALLPDGRLSLVVGKVSAGGTQAGVALASTRALLRSAGQRLLPPGEALDECNALHTAQHPPSLSVCVLYLLLDPSSGKTVYAAAGVNALRLRDAEIVQDLPIRSQPLGASGTGEIEAGEITLGPHHLLVLLGPSMLETRDADGRAFVDQPLDEVLKDRPGNLQELADRILDSFKAFNRKSPLLAPDRTVVVLERPAPEM